MGVAGGFRPIAACCLLAVIDIGLVLDGGLRQRSLGALDRPDPRGLGALGAKVVLRDAELPRPIIVVAGVGRLLHHSMSLEDSNRLILQ